MNQPDTIRELIDQLEELAQEHGDDCEVKVAYQPSYPLESSIHNVRMVGKVAYLALQGNNGYGPAAAWEEQ